MPRSSVPGEPELKARRKALIVTVTVPSLQRGLHGRRRGGVPIGIGQGSAEVSRNASAEGFTSRAGDGSRTHDNLVGNEVLYH